MANNVIMFTAPSGFAGSISRPGSTKVEPAMLVATSSVFAQSVGIPMKFVPGGITQFSGGETSDQFAGILAREFPTGGAPNLSQGFNDFIPNFKQVQSLVVGGYVNVACTIGTPVRGGAVYARIVAATGKNVGDFEATADGANNLLLAGVFWAVDGKDANNITELKIGK